MKRTFLALVSMLNISSAATQLTVEGGQLFSAFYAYVSIVPLPDGMSLFGNYVPGSKPFDFEHINDDGNPAYLKTVNLSELLRKTETSRENIEQRLKDIKKSYDFIVAELYKLTPSAVSLFDEILTNSNLFGTTLLIPKQKERADNYHKIANWRIFHDPRPEDALEAIRIERERLDAIAAEEAAKRKAETDAKSAEETARIADAESARLESAKKVPESSGLRRRKGHEATTIPGLDDDDRAAVVTTPLLTPHGKPVRAH